MTNTNQENMLCDSMTIGRKIGLLLDYLQDGGEVEIDGRTWVWLDNYVTREEVDEYCEIQRFGIDGLAIKGVSIDTKTNTETPHYLGQTDIPLHAFINLVEQVKEKDWVGMSARTALKSMNKKRG